MKRNTYKCIHTFLCGPFVFLSRFEEERGIDTSRSGQSSIFEKKNFSGEIASPRHSFFSFFSFLLCPFMIGRMDRGRYRRVPVNNKRHRVPISRVTSVWMRKKKERKYRKRNRRERERERKRELLCRKKESRSLKVYTTISPGRFLTAPPGVLLEEKNLSVGLCGALPLYKTMSSVFFRVDHKWKMAEAILICLSPKFIYSSVFGDTLIPFVSEMTPGLRGRRWLGTHDERCVFRNCVASL